MDQKSRFPTNPEVICFEEARCSSNAKGQSRGRATVGG